jgi:multidrug efflux pump subunit AcrA (membrane-fusion protein)
MFIQQTAIKYKSKRGFLVMKKIYLMLSIVLLIGILTACSNDDQKEETGEAVTPVETAGATEGDLVLTKTLYGRTQPVSVKPVTLDGPGEIKTLHVENGDQVDKDEALAVIKYPEGEQKIKAPQSGEVASLEAAEGDLVSGEDPLAVIADMKKMKITFTVTADVQKTLEKEAKYQVHINDKQYEAEITSIASMPDDTGLYPVEAKVENEDKAFLAGMTAAVEIPEKRVKQAIILPTAAIVEENDEAFIYIIKDDKAVKTEIDIQETQSDQTAVKGEVKEGDLVVTNGHLTLSDGDKVNVVKESGE